MTKTDIKSLLNIIPTTENPEFDDYIAKAKKALDEKPNPPEHIESQSEKEILEGCIQLMQSLTNSFIEWYNGTHGENAMQNLDEEERFYEYFNYETLVNHLFLENTTHSGSTSTRKKCNELGVDYTYPVTFTMLDNNETF